MSGQSEAKVGELQPTNAAFATLVAGKRNESLAVLGDNELEVTPLATDQYGRLLLASLTPGTGATNLGKAEDAVHASGDTGVMFLGVRNDSNNTFAADGDYLPFNVDASGKIKFSMEKVQDTAYGGADKGLPIFGVRNDSNVTLINNNIGYGCLSLDSTGRLKIAGTRGEDSAHTTGDDGFPVFAVRQDTLTTLVDTTGDYANLKCDATGRVYVNPMRETVLRAGNTIAFGSITNAYAALIASNSYNGRVMSVLVINTTDAVIDISYDSANSFLPVPPDSQYIWDFGANGGGLARTAFQLKYTGAAPTRGSLYFRLQDEN